MDEDTWCSKCFILWHVDQTNLLEVLIGCHTDVYLPIIFVLLNPVLVKSIIIYKLRPFFQKMLLYLRVDKEYFPLLRLVFQKLFNFNINVCTCPLHENLVIFDSFFHEITDEENCQVWHILQFSKFFNDQPDLVDLSHVSVYVF